MFKEWIRINKFHLFPGVLIFHYFGKEDFEKKKKKKKRRLTRTKLFHGLTRIKLFHGHF